MQNLSRNKNIIFASNFLQGLTFFLPILALYLEQELFTIFNVGIVLSVQAIFIVVFEIPSGAVSDLFGRKRTLIFSQLFGLLGLYFLILGGTMNNFIIYAILSALARALHSGTDTSLLFESVAKNEFKEAVGINGVMWPAGAAIGSAIGGLLAAESLVLPVQVTIIPYAFALIVYFFLRESEHERHTHGVLTHMKHAGKIALHTKQIFVLSLAGFFFYSFGETVHQLNPIFFAAKSLPIEIFGLIFTGIFAFSSIGFYSHHGFNTPELCSG